MLLKIMIYVVWVGEDTQKPASHGTRQPRDPPATAVSKCVLDRWERKRGSQSGFSTVQRGGTGDSREERNGQMGVSALPPETMLKLWLVLRAMPGSVTRQQQGSVLMSMTHITT